MHQKDKTQQQNKQQPKGSTAQNDMPSGINIMGMGGSGKETSEKNIKAILEDKQQ